MVVSFLKLSGALKDISPFIRRYEGLSYDRGAVHRSHERAKRETQEHKRVIQLDFTAFQRAFHLRLRRDTTGFTEDFRIHLKNASQSADLSHIYSGGLEDERGSSCHGSILAGQFEGFIQTQNATYYVEPIERYSTSHSEHHSIIYREDDMGVGEDFTNKKEINSVLGRYEKDVPICKGICASETPSPRVKKLELSRFRKCFNLNTCWTQMCLHKNKWILTVRSSEVYNDSSPLRNGGASFCGSRRLLRFTQDSSHQAMSRSRRTVDSSKTSCTLHLRTDHLYFKTFGSVEAIVAQADRFQLQRQGQCQHIALAGALCPARFIAGAWCFLRAVWRAAFPNSKITQPASRPSLSPVRILIVLIYQEALRDVPILFPSAPCAMVASYIRAVNDIYHRVDFEGIRLINFKVKVLDIITEDDPSSPLYPAFIGPEKLLMLFSETNWDKYCLSYLLTNRDYSGVLGLAWEGKPGNSGGICSKYAKFKDGSSASLNTGLITLQNYGQYLPARMVHFTIAHELGHSLGAPHDEGSNCGELGSLDGKGRYLMFPQASHDRQENNDKFSPCSIQLISKLLRAKKDQCFVVIDQPICGNQIAEEGEECDVGHNDSDPCCYSANQPRTIQCKLKPHKQCSPSQGPCCSSQCVLRPPGVVCKEESECQLANSCSGSTATCPTPASKPNTTVCGRGTRVCTKGECGRSLCVKYGLEQCDCLGNSMTEKCFLCCQQPGKPETCASTTSSVLSQYFSGARIALLPGTPCSGKQGYCDRFNVCRLLDADGPIARLKNSFLHLNEFDDLAEWMKASSSGGWLF
ncbi:ADA10 protein, partial [Atractosteus spatula]|nr:ADA10 protein [Atractosteus spatula]